jgi:methylmalonyl-CoA/ethylmalonyl-CoA epimerase
MMASDLPAGLAGLRYPITQVSLVVDDADPLLERYYRTFGWAPWQDFDHVTPVHHNTMYRGKEVEYSLRGAEVYVGSLNFELLEPIPGGDSLFHEHQRTRGDGIASIASMFHERADGDAVKAAFKAEFGLDVINRAEIGDHIEYYYVDTQVAFGCPIESGSGHAIDFVGPARIYPDADATFGPAPSSGITYRIAQVTLVVDELDSRVANYRKAFGWGPWRVFDTQADLELREATYRGEPAKFDLRCAQTRVGELNFEIVQPRGGASPWRDFLDTAGEGLMGITVVPEGPAGIEKVTAALAGEQVGVLASAQVGASTWTLFDTQADFATHIATSTGLAYEAVGDYDEVG